MIHDLTNSTSDDLVLGRSKETDTSNWVIGPHSVPNKDDIADVYASTQVVNAHRYLYIGSTRIVNNGDTTLDFEFNQKAATGDIPNRSVGDIIITFQFVNGGSVPTVTIYKVTALSGTVATFTDITPTAPTSLILAAVNDKTIANPDPNSTAPSSLDSNEFGEASLDLTGLGLGSCPGFGQGEVRSRAGTDLLSSQLKDTTSPFPIDLSNCGALTWQKQDDKSQALCGATFTVAPNPFTGSSTPLQVIDNTGQGATPARTSTRGPASSSSPTSCPGRTPSRRPRPRRVIPWMLTRRRRVSLSPSSRPPMSPTSGRTRH